MTYKDPAVTSGFIEASSLAIAEKLGREYCNTSKRKFIGIREAILVREEVPPAFNKSDIAKAVEKK